MTGDRGPLIAFAALCVASELVLLVMDRGYAAVAAGFVVYLALVYLAVIRLVPPPPKNEGANDDDVLVARSPRGTLPARAAIMLASVVLMFLHTFTLGGAPNLVPALHTVYRWLAMLPPHSGSAYPNFVLFALVPGALVLLLGVRPHQLGLSRPAPGTFKAGALAIGLFVIAFAVRLVQGYPVQALAAALFHNVLSNGFTEEFWTRGLVFAHLRAFLRSDWALVLQALVFALMHLGGSLHDEPNLLGDVANVIALNAPMGFVLGLIALRTRSLALPVAIHLCLDTVRNVFS